MRGFPKSIGCKQDLINLKQDYPVETLEKLQEILSEASQTMSRVVSGSEETGDLVMEILPNPYPLWSRLGFNSLQEVEDMING
jgi:hypothetical protein